MTLSKMVMFLVWFQSIFAAFLLPPFYSVYYKFIWGYGFLSASQFFWTPYFIYISYGYWDPTLYNSHCGNELGFQNAFLMFLLSLIVLHRGDRMWSVRDADGSSLIEHSISVSKCSTGAWQEHMFSVGFKSFCKSTLGILQSVLLFCNSLICFVCWNLSS